MRFCCVYKYYDSLLICKMLIIHEKKIIFLHNPKVFGKELTKWLRKNSDIPQLLYKTPTKYCPDLGHLNLRNYDNYVSKTACKNYDHIVFIRDPIQRFDSGFHEIFKHDVGYKYMQRNNLYTKNSFIDYLYRNPEQLYHPHLIWIIPQHVYIYDKNGKKVSYVFKYENLYHNLKTIASWLKIHDFPYEILQENKKKEYNFNEEQIQKLQWIYKDDYYYLF